MVPWSPDALHSSVHGLEVCTELNNLLRPSVLTTKLFTYMLQMRWVHLPVQTNSHKIIFFFQTCVLLLSFWLLSFIRVSVFNSLVRLQKADANLSPSPTPLLWLIPVVSVYLPPASYSLWSNYLKRQRNEREHLTFKSLSARRPRGDDTNTRTRPHIIHKMQFKSVWHAIHINTHSHK